MSLLTPQVQPPTGRPRMPVISGTVFKTMTPLNANGSVSTGWFSTEGFTSLGFVFNSDKPGFYTIEYSDDGVNLSVPIITVNYTNGDVGIRRKGAIDPDSIMCRVTYHNGSVAQTSFYMTLQLKTSVFQASLETLGAKGATSRFAQWVKSQVHLNDGNGNYDDVTRTGNAMNVNVTNQSTATDVSLLAKDGTDATNVNPLSGATGIRGWLSSIYQRLANGTQNTQIVNGNNQPFGGTDRPFNVAVSNPTTATDVSALAKDATLTSLLNKVISAPSTEAKQDALNILITALNQKDFATQATLVNVLSILGNGNQKTVVTNTDYAKESGGNLAAIASKDFATQTTLAAILAKIIALPATESKQDSANVLLTSIRDKLLSSVSVTGTFFQATQPVSAAALPLPNGASTEATLAAVLAKLIVAPSTEAKQDAGNTSLANIYNKLNTGTIQVASIPTSTGGYPSKGYYQPSGTGGGFTLIATGVRKLGSLIIANTSNSVITIMLYDKATAPVAADTAVQAYVLPANTVLCVELGDGMHFNNGIGIGAVVGANLLSLVSLLLTAISAGTVTVSYNYV